MGWQFEKIDNPNINVVKENEELKKKVEELQNKSGQNNRPQQKKSK